MVSNGMNGFCERVRDKAGDRAEAEGTMVHPSK